MDKINDSLRGQVGLLTSPLKRRRVRPDESAEALVADLAPKDAGHFAKVRDPSWQMGKVKTWAHRPIAFFRKTVHDSAMFKSWIRALVTAFLFFPEEEFIELPNNLGLVSETAECLTADGLKLHNWFFPVPNAKATVLFFHGNAGNISGRLWKAQGWLERGVAVFLLDYRGYGKSEGVIKDERDLYLDAEAALRWLKEKKGLAPSQIILYGESIGSAAATELATREKFKGLILEAPFSTLQELAKHHYPWVPSYFVRDFQFKNVDKMAHILSPVFILHGTADEVCPYRMGRELFEKAPEPKEMLTIPDGHHNDLMEKGGVSYFDRPCKFLIG